VRLDLIQIHRSEAAVEIQAVVEPDRLDRIVPEQAAVGFESAQRELQGQDTEQDLQAVGQPVQVAADTEEVVHNFDRGPASVAAAVRLAVVVAVAVVGP
jgi:hypothetical protein